MSSFHLLLQRHEGSLCLKEPLTLEEWISCSVNGGVWCHSSLKGWFKGRNTGRGRFGGESNVQIVKIISSFNRILRVPTVRPTVRLYTSWREWAGFHQKGVEWKWTELSDEITMATRTSAVQSEGGGGGGGGGMWEGVSCWRGLKWEGIALHFLRFFGRFSWPRSKHSQ